MTVEQKRKIERELNWLSSDCAKNEIVGILFTLDVLGYCAYPTKAKNRYEIMKKKGDKK